MKPIEVRLSSNRQQINRFLSDYARWAATRPDILGVAMVGSYARNEATRMSDVDLVIIASDPEAYLQDMQWAQFFGTIRRQQIEHYGKVTSLRVWYSDGPEVEYGFTDPSWTSLPLDEGTKMVISSGLQILFERDSALSRMERPDRLS